jgi:DNA-binding NtrC family response regulator
VVNSAKGGSSNDFSERDLFYKILFDLKGDMNDLKKIVYELLKNNQNKSDVIKDNEAIIRRVMAGSDENDNDMPQVIISQRNEDNRNDDDEDLEHEILEPESVGSNENLSLEAKEEELIKKSLLRNNGKRKNAAKELGISERTLYRKIKQYELE